jgi:APA family basic amino acid/polyamine antiporter
MSAPRIYYAMAKDEVFFKKLSQLHPRFKTPHFAIILQAFWASLLVVMWGSFIKIITFVTFMDIVFMALATFSIFIFRRRQSEKPTFYLKAYPIIPIIYLLITVSFVFNTLLHLSTEAWVGVGILLLGIPSYLLFKKKNM